MCWPRDPPGTSCPGTPGALEYPGWGLLHMAVFLHCAHGPAFIREILPEFRFSLCIPKSLAVGLGICIFKTFWGNSDGHLCLLKFTIISLLLACYA